MTQCNLTMLSWTECPSFSLQQRLLAILIITFPTKIAWLSVLQLKSKIFLPFFGFESFQYSAKYTNALVMQGSILPVAIPPGHTPGDLQFFSYLVVYSPPPGTQKETIPHPRDSSSTTNTLFCVQNWFPYNSTTRRFDTNLSAFLEFTERRILHSIKNHWHYIEKENS